MDAQMIPAILTNITPQALMMIPSSRFNLALIWSYRKAQTASCEFNRASVSLIVAMTVMCVGYWAVICSKFASKRLSCGANSKALPKS